MDKIIEGVYVQVVERQKVVQKYIPLNKVKLENGKTLEEYLGEIKREVVEANAKASENIERMNNLENVFEETIRGFITK
jgi:hypothetical protein